MKLFLIFIPAFLLFISFKHSVSIEKLQPQKARNFRLHFARVGFGSNMFTMQPAFKIDGTKFIYLSEEAWIFPGETKRQKDTLLVGRFRTSSMDSISKLIREVKDTAIFRVNSRIMSGSASYITIDDGLKKIKFDLHNDSDTTADKIVAILNTYIPEKFEKLSICCGL